MASNQNDPARPGNALFVRNEYEKALEAYSTAIEKNPDMTKLYSNRALTYLKLDRPFHALKDVEIGLKLEPDNDKLIYRKCKALLALRRFTEAAQFLNESIGRLEQLTKNKEFKTLVDDMTRLKMEYEYGQYDLLAMIGESKKSKFLDNHADYYARNKFAIREVEGKGRGLVAKEKIEAGELLIACKAFVYMDTAADSEVIQSIGLPFEILSLTDMVGKVHEKLTNRPDLAEQFYRLYAGSKLGHLEKWTEGESELFDMDRAVWISRTNRFETAPIGEEPASAQRGPDDSGLWLIPSFLVL